MLDSALRGIATVVLLPHLVGAIIIKGIPCTLQKAAIIFLFRPYKRLLKGWIDGENIINIKHPIFRMLIIMPFLVIKRKWDLISFKVSERKMSVPGIAVRLTAIIKKTIHHIICANLSDNETYSLILRDDQSLKSVINHLFTSATYVLPLNQFL